MIREELFQKGKFYTLPIKNLRSEGNNTFFIVEANNKEYAIRMFDFQKTDEQVLKMKELPWEICSSMRIHLLTFFQQKIFLPIQTWNLSGILKNK